MEEEGRSPTSIPFPRRPRPMTPQRVFDEAVRRTFPTITRTPNKQRTQMHSLNLPGSLRRLASATVLFGIISHPLSKSFGQSPAAARRLAAIDLTDRTFHHATLEISGETLMIRHRDGIFNQRLDELSHKTLLRIGTVEPSLRGSAAYQSALGRFLPEMKILGRAVTGVRLETLDADLATFVTDQGRASCRWSELSIDHRTFFLSEKARLDDLRAARIEHERQRQEILASAERAREAERQRVLAARQMEMDRQNREAEEAQTAEAAEGVLGAVVAAGALYGLYHLLKEGSNSGPSQSEMDRINDWANKRAAKEWEERLNQAP